MCGWHPAASATAGANAAIANSPGTTMPRNANPNQDPILRIAPQSGGLLGRAMTRSDQLCGDVWPGNGGCAMLALRTRGPGRAAASEGVAMKAPVVTLPAGCETPFGSITDVIDGLIAIGDSLPPNDGLGHFNRMYLAVTQGVRDAASDGMFTDS